jgi:GNAT superfamily N-acetyltransferase
MSGTEPRVRPARAEEADLLIEFQARGVRAIFDDRSLGEYWVAELEGEVVGCLLLTREWSDWRNGTVLWIQSVYVQPEARRRGVYRALYQHIRLRVETTPDLRGIRLYVEQRNRGAHDTYERLGMRQDHYTLFEWMK